MPPEGSSKGPKGLGDVCVRVAGANHPEVKEELGQAAIWLKTSLLIESAGLDLKGLRNRTTGEPRQIALGAVKEKNRSEKLAPCL